MPNRRDELDELMPFLTPRERDVIAFRLGEIGRQGISRQEIAERLKLTVEEVIDTEASAGKKIGERNVRRNRCRMQVKPVMVASAADSLPKF
jgi:DNA-directed RNA polymerase sigma subunit (sigma70/sigma32)